MQNIVIVAEQYKGKIAPVGPELLGIARELAGPDGKITAILAGEGFDNQGETLAGYGADRVYLLDGPQFARYNTECYAQAVGDVIKECAPDIVLFGATSIGRDLAPRISARLDTGLTADCTKLEIDAEGNFLMTRPAFGGNLFATIICPEHRPQMSTVRPGVMKARPFESGRKAEIIRPDVSGIKARFPLRILEENPLEIREKDILEVKILVSCGRGVGDKASLEAARELAELLDGTVSSSRALVDAGILPQYKQVGQTGKTVRPMVYLANGISGAVQHLAGMSESEFIVAVNKDPDAPIFGTAHLGVVSDARKVLPLLAGEIRKIQAEKAAMTS
jgi:electron transfer flavoprotein alpha subunit